MAMTEATDSKVVEMVPNAEERAFTLAQREATALSQSQFIPKEFRGSIPDCLIALNMAKRIGSDPLAVMQSLYIVHGKPALSASFMIGCFNTCGRFTPIEYRIEGEGDERSWTAVTTVKETGQEIEGPTVSMAMAHAEGWVNKNGSKWKTMPDLMGRYRAGAFLVRTVAPEISLGLHTAEEAHDMAPSRDPGANATSAADALRNARDVTPTEDAHPDVPGEAAAGDGESGLSTTPAVSEEEVDAAFGLGGEGE